VWQEILTLAMGWGIAALIITFWYWLLKSIGTF
jgi:hypothetical protein